MVLADAASFSTPWSAAAIVVSLAVLVIGIVNTRSQRAEDRASREKKDADDLVRAQRKDAEALARAQDEKALAAHHRHDDERFDAIDRRLTALAEARRDGDHDLGNKLAVTHLEVARLQERFAALKGST